MLLQNSLVSTLFLANFTLTRLKSNIIKKSLNICLLLINIDQCNYSLIATMKDVIKHAVRQCRPSSSWKVNKDMCFRSKYSHKITQDALRTTYNHRQNGGHFWKLPIFANFQRKIWRGLALMEIYLAVTLSGMIWWRCPTKYMWVSLCTFSAISDLMAKSMFRHRDCRHTIFEVLGSKIFNLFQFFFFFTYMLPLKTPAGGPSGPPWGHNKIAKGLLDSLLILA